MSSTQRTWDRQQWVGDQGHLAADPTSSPAGKVARWGLHQWVGDQGTRVSTARYEYAPEDDGMPHGFDGFGVSDSGGQQWAAGLVETFATAPVLVVADDEAAEEVA